MYSWRIFAEGGGLMSYSTDLAAIYRRAATYVRAGDQPQDGQGARPDDPAVVAAAGGRGHRVAAHFSIVSLPR
jgi:hypothetical protein